MKNEVLYLLLNNYADHEAVFLASAIACDERSIKENPKYTNKVVAPTLMLYAHAVVSILYPTILLKRCPMIMPHWY
jgi:hypothetical protein